MLGTDRQYEGQVKPSSIEKNMYEPTLFAGRFTEIPSNMQMDADYGVRTDSQMDYLGFAPKGLADGTDGWIIHKFTYDVSDRMTKREIGYGNWTGRTGLSYG